MLPNSLQNHLQEVGIKIQNSQPISGGDINQAALLHCTDQRQFFVKYNTSVVAPAMLGTEAEGLQVLQTAQAIRIPQIIAQGQTTEGIAFLVLEYIQGGARQSTFWQQFGTSLAALHRHSAPQFGLDHANFKRIEIYQLYYLLVHVNLFGRSYVPAVRSVLQHF